MCDPILYKLEIEVLTLAIASDTSWIDQTESISSKVWSLWYGVLETLSDSNLHPAAVASYINTPTLPLKCHCCSALPSLQLCLCQASNFSCNWTSDSLRPLGIVSRKAARLLLSHFPLWLQDKSKERSVLSMLTVVSLFCFFFNGGVF